MNDSVYSPYKIVHHPTIIEDLKHGEHVFPLQVHLVPSNKCNQNCGFCAYRMHGYSSSQNFSIGSQIPTEKLLETIKDLSDHGCQAIQYTGGGEPLMHPDIDKAFELTLKNNLKLGLVTNGVLLNDKLIDILSNNNVSWIRVSVDAFKADTYIKTRQVMPIQYDLMLKNITSIINKKSSETILGIGYVITKENYKEVYQAAKFFKELGVDNIRISAAFTDRGFSYFDGWFEEAKEIVRKAHSDFNDESFTVFNLFNDRAADLFHGTQDYDFCPMKNLVPYIGADLNVYTCCTLAYNDKGTIGSIENQKFSDLWYDPHVVGFMKNHNPRHSCRLPCMFESKNKFINYCIDKKAKHTAFI